MTNTDQAPISKEDAGFPNEQAIEHTILDVLKEIDEPDEAAAFTLAIEVTTALNERFPDTIPAVSAVADVIEEMFIKFNYPKAARAYILHRASDRAWGRER